MRIGQGYDIHRLAEGNSLVIGGVHFEDSPVGTVAHSDGDVLLHALIDALLGAAGLGDIGDHFPPSDDRYKDADSSDLLREVLDLLTGRSCRIINVDSTLFLEAPKLGSRKAEIRHRVAELIGIPADRVSVKAKTMEKLGSIGAGEALAASVTVLLSEL